MKKNTVLLVGGVALLGGILVFISKRKADQAIQQTQSQASQAIAQAQATANTAVQTANAQAQKQIETSRYEGMLIKPQNSALVYVVKDGKKQWITSMDAFNRRGYKTSDIVVLPPATIDSIPDGNPLSGMRGLSGYQLT